MPALLCFGFGYTARALAPLLAAEGWAVAGTSRGGGADVPFDAPGEALERATHVLSSVPPDESGDPVLRRHAAALAGRQWVGYLSTTGVYGDTGGAVVDESAPLRPTSARARRRVEAEAAWLALWRSRGVPVHVFRLAGIYGPGRSAFDQIRAGTARRIDRPGHAFNRIHVDDIALVLRASMARPNPGAVYNVCDDAPAEPAEVVAHACELLALAPPPLTPFAEAARAMSPMAASFWADNRRVSNARIKAELGVRLRFPDYRAGLRAILG